MSHKNAYERLVAENGIEGAKQIMRERRKLVKKPGLANTPKARVMEISAMGNAAKRKKHADKNNPGG